MQEYFENSNSPIRIVSLDGSDIYRRMHKKDGGGSLSVKDEKGKPVTESYYEMSRSFTTDPSRILRAIRYCAEREFVIDDATRAAMRQNVSCFEYAEADKVFKELFGGGQANLELMDDDDILEAGIKIIAQPPGKKLQNMMQLSGGEKALTAISLLFAIQNLKPSPFCLLDEIEAALDESNVDRFAKYLHKMTKSTQFIVITHRRGTMDQANQLYGITMQEKGVSTLVSVDLQKNEA
jgi:chromosome segregation protein